MDAPLGSLPYIGGLRSSRTPNDFKLHLVAFLQALVSIDSDGADMHEDIGATFTGDESISFCEIKPLDRTLQSFHAVPLVSPRNFLALLRQTCPQTRYLCLFGIVVSLASFGHFTSLDSPQNGQGTPRCTSPALLYAPETVNVFLHLVHVMIFSMVAPAPAQFCVGPFHPFSEAANSSKRASSCLRCSFVTNANAPHS